MTNNTVGNAISAPLAKPPIHLGMIGPTPRDAAIQTMNNKAQLQTMLTGTGPVKGGMHRRHRRKKGGAAESTQKLVVPVPTPLYPVTGNNSQNITVSGIQSYNQQSLNNATFASQLAGKTGGTRIMGPNKTWGCYSGGKKYRQTKRHRKKTRKSRKMRKYGRK